MSFLSLENVSLTFASRKILDGIGLVIDGGSILSLSGRSGSGKTTLLGIISGMCRPDGGTVLYRGRDVYRWGDLRRSRYRNREIGFVFQTFNLFPEMTVYRNITYPAVMNRFSRDVKKKADYLVDYLGLGDIAAQMPSTLSGGEKQRVAVARALINEPSLILADEPTGNLDEKSGRTIFDLFREINRDRGVVFLIATHDRHIIAHSDLHYHLEEGKLIPKKA